MLRRLRPPADGRDAGLTLVELLVAIVLFGLAATGIAYGLQIASKSTRDNRMRVQGANLAARELEISRNEFNRPGGPAALASVSSVNNPHALPGQTAGAPLTIDGAKFTVRRTVQWMPAGAGQSPCDGGSAVTYPSLAVHVEVSWSQMGLTEPVVSNTVLTPPKGTLNSSMGFVAVKVQGANGLGVSNVPVVLSGPTTQTRDTAGDGCAVFALTTMGTYTASVNVPGYVAYDGSASASRSATVTAGSLTQVPLIAYDEAATLRTQLTTLPGHALPMTLPRLTLFNSGLPAPFTKKYTSTGTNMTITSLWPFTDGYSVWAGYCNQADPAAAGGSRPAATPLSAGADVTVQVQVAPVAVHVLDANDLPVSLASVRATPVSTTGCTGGETLSLGSTDLSGNLLTSLPAGAYTLTVLGRTPETAWTVTPSLLPLDTPTDQTVVVN